MNNAFQIPNYRQIKVKAIPATNTRGTRIKIYESARYNDQKTTSKMFGYNYEIGDVLEQAYQILVNNGYNVVARASEQDNYVLLCNNWGEDFGEGINNLKE